MVINGFGHRINDSVYLYKLKGEKPERVAKLLLERDSNKPRSSPRGEVVISYLKENDDTLELILKYAEKYVRRSCISPLLIAIPIANSLVIGDFISIYDKILLVSPESENIIYQFVERDIQHFLDSGLPKGIWIFSSLYIDLSFSDPSDSEILLDARCRKGITSFHVELGDSEPELIVVTSPKEFSNVLRRRNDVRIRYNLIERKQLFIERFYHLGEDASKIIDEENEREAEEGFALKNK